MRQFAFLYLYLLIVSSIYSQTAQRYDVVIDEIMFDPTPVVGLPSAEYIEIKNTTGKNINLAGWKLRTPTSASAAFPNYILAPDSFAIVCSNASATLLSSFGRVIAIASFPALNNDGSILSLTSKENLTI